MFNWNDLWHNRCECEETIQLGKETLMIPCNSPSIKKVYCIKKRKIINVCKTHLEFPCEYLKI